MGFELESGLGLWFCGMVLLPPLLLFSLLTIVYSLYYCKEYGKCVYRVNVALCVIMV